MEKLTTGLEPYLSLPKLLLTARQDTAEQVTKVHRLKKQVIIITLLVVQKRPCPPPIAESPLRTCPHVEGGMFNRHVSSKHTGHKNPPRQRRTVSPVAHVMRAPPRWQQVPHSQQLAAASQKNATKEQQQNKTQQLPVMFHCATLNFIWCNFKCPHNCHMCYSSRKRHREARDGMKNSKAFCSLFVGRFPRLEAQVACKSVVQSSALEHYISHRIFA